MLQIPFAFQWSIPEYQLNDLKDSVNEYLLSASLSNIPGIEYFLSLYPNGIEDKYSGNVQIFLQLELGNVKKVEAEYTVKIESANYSYQFRHEFENSEGYGRIICKTKQLFNSEKNFIVNGKCTIKVYGIFKFENGDDPTLNFEQQKWDGGELGNELWIKNDNKDFTIIVDEKEIKVHKFILGSRSKVFSAVFKETKENQMEIRNFSFEVVETAAKMIYNSECATFLSTDDLMSLLQFFDKYDIPSLKDKVEPILINQISAATVCRLTNCSIFTNSIRIKKKCMEFLMDSFSSKTYLNDILTLDKNVALEILHNSLFKIVGTQ